MNYIIGTNYSGISLLAGILNCSRQIQITGEDPNTCLHPLSYNELKIHGTKTLDRLYDLVDDNPKFIWIVRHPFIVSIKHHKKELIDFRESFKYWVDANTILWYFTHSLPDTMWINIKFENILLEQKKSVKSSFDLIGVPFIDQYLHYGDFPQPAFEGSSFKNGKLDVEQVDPEFYDNSLVNELCKSDIFEDLGYAPRE